MRAVILAAGEGTRLRPYTVSESKGMIPVANRPILTYILEALVSNGITDVTLVVGYRKERILSHFEDGRRVGAKLSYVTQEKQLGIAHALLQAKAQLTEPFLVLAGDNLVDARSVKDILTLAKGGHPAALLAESERPVKYGVVTLKGDRIEAIHEKPEERLGNLVLTGVYCLGPEIFPVIEEQIRAGETGLSAAVGAYASQHPVRAGVTHGEWIDAVYPWDLLDLNAAALGRAKSGTAGKIEKEVTLSGPVSIGLGTTLRAGTTIYGPVVIGEGCEIGPHVTIFPSTSIGDGVAIEPYTLVRHSLIMASVAIGPHSHLSHCVVGAGTRLGSHFIASSNAAHVQVEEEFHRVPRIGALLGEDVTVGSGVVANPGTILGAGCKVASGVRLSGTTPSQAIIA